MDLGFIPGIRGLIQFLNVICGFIRIVKIKQAYTS
jgi:hypothetical protein